MDSNKLKAIIIVILALFAALYLGISAATAQFETIAWVVGGLTLFICVALGRKIWLLLPFMMAMDLTFRLPGLPTSLLIAQILVIGFSVLLLLMRKLNFHLKFTELEFWAFCLLLMVGQVYLRNPVGLNVFGGGSVGGRPYILFGITFVSAILLVGLRVPAKEIKQAMQLTIFGGLINVGLSVLGRFIPILGYAITESYNISSETDHTKIGQTADTGNASRNHFLGIFGNNLALWISAFKAPHRACFHPIWGTLIVISLAAAMMSGFRSMVVMAGLSYMLGVFYRGGLPGIFASFLLGGISLIFLAIGNMAMPFPPNIQRSLSFLPGTWEERYIDDAEGSTEWRVEIWKEALLTDRWIKNKLLGDGLGFSAAELAAQMNYRQGSRAGISGFEAHRESVMANGDYHSGPVQMVRIIGYFGLVIVVFAQIRLAMHAHRQIMRCKGTEWFTVALLFGIPLVWNPFFFFFVFGDFKAASITLLVGIGMIRLLENNLPLPAWKRPNRVHMPLIKAPHQRSADTVKQS
jgi:hypothetical protein